MSTTSAHTTAFVLALLGGIIITVGSAIEIVLLTFGSYSGTFYGMGPGMMSGYGFYGYGAGWLTALSAVALVFGIIVLVGAIMLNIRPTQNITWGIVVVVFSVASFIGMGGYMMGAVLGIAGGAIALSYRTTTSAGS
ncbi:MAG: hypothetical protein M1490_03040 [Candidatus Bathyarchaeota archaeon]|nr:hypothetical protein [Candidatus Bathyarchaeota archaeon]